MGLEGAVEGLQYLRGGEPVEGLFESGGLVGVVVVVSCLGVVGLWRGCGFMTFVKLEFLLVSLRVYVLCFSAPLEAIGHGYRHIHVFLAIEESVEAVRASQ